MIVVVQATFLAVLSASPASFAEVPAATTPAASAGRVTESVAPRRCPSTRWFSVGWVKSDGVIRACWSTSTVPGATYILEYSRDGVEFLTAYRGPATAVDHAVTASGTYTFRVRVTRAGYVDSDAVTRTCSVELKCGTPLFFKIYPPTSRGTIPVFWSESDVPGVTYILELARNGGAFVTAYTGPATAAYPKVAENGVYTFRLRATKPGYAESDPLTGSPEVTPLPEVANP